MRARPPSAAAEREVRGDTPLRRARTCYAHLAGVAGVALTEALLARRWLVVAGRAGGRPRYRLTAAGARALATRGVRPPARGESRRPLACGCLDWTERRHHLAGALGEAVLRALLRARVVRRAAGTRAVTVAAPLAGWLAAPSGRATRDA